MRGGGGCLTLLANLAFTPLFLTFTGSLTWPVGKRSIPASPLLIRSSSVAGELPLPLPLCFSFHGSARPLFLASTSPGKISIPANPLMMSLL